jgi:cytochrome c peroxidase
MHDGSLATLEDVIDFYDGGGRTNPNLDSDIRPLRLSAGEKAGLAAFLRALNGDMRDDSRHQMNE